MRVSQLLIPTLREDPAEAEIVSHKLLLRGGFIRKSAAGIYTYLPLAQRVLEKIKKIVREEMDRQGGQEIMMPILQSAEIWQESGRWDVYGKELFRLKDRHERDFCLGPTHEEIITSLVRNEVKSYKQLPLLLYQIQNKYRDEKRPRFGLMRGREFIMKDLYSFDKDEEGLEISYRKMYEAYSRVFKRCGLSFRAVEADSGAIGGSTTHEFMVLAESGEALVVYCPDEKCGYAANVEKASTVIPGETEYTKSTEERRELEKVPTPGKRTVEDICTFFKVTPDRLIKTLLYKTEKGVVAALVRGDREVNETKLKNVLECLTLELADAQTVERVSGAPVGFAGPVGIEGVEIIADYEVTRMVNGITGANEVDAHCLNVNPGRDFTPDIIEDIRIVNKGEPCPHCGTPLETARGIEVGQIFNLGTKYSKALEATFLDEKGQQRYFVMGCYGIGVSRVMAAAVEQNHDENGIVWPSAIAPFEVVVVPVSSKDKKQMALAEKIYKLLIDKGIESILDDRDERAGVKFKDADLVGYPLRITVGRKAVKEEIVEIKSRSSGNTVTVPLEKVVDEVKVLVKQDTV